MGLTREDIVRAATRVAGEQGVSALSMRAVARELGVSPMALYNHVENREDLVGAISQSFVTYALSGEGGVIDHATQLFEDLRRWPYMVGLLREAPLAGTQAAVSDMLGRLGGDTAARDRAAADWLALSQLALGLVEAEQDGRADNIDTVNLFVRAAEALSAS